MKVTKRNGSLEEIKYDKITARLELLCDGLDSLDPSVITKEISNRIYDKITTNKLDNIAADLCASKSVVHPDFGILSSRLVVNAHQKNSKKKFSEVVGMLKNLLDSDLYDLVMAFPNKYDDIVKHERDYYIDYFGFKTLYKSYLLKIGDTPVETPQYLWLRVALGIHGSRFDKVVETYNLLSQKFFTHATPTLFNAGTKHPQLSSCFLLSTGDSIEEIFKTVGDCAKISKWAGGIGLSVSDIRAKDSKIRGTGGKTSDIVKMLRIYNDTALYVNQGGKRAGSFAMYMEPWHADIYSFLEAMRNNGDPSLRARDLFYALWVPDIFMRRMFMNENDGMWTLMCPDECPGLSDSYGEEFDKLYLDYESRGMGRKTIKISDLYNEIINSQIEKGMPYILFKDSCNRKSNQKNLGTIKCSNLCAEIVQYSSTSEYSVCNLASLCLPQYIKEKSFFDFTKLYEVVRLVTYNLNRIIDINYYPCPETRKSNMANRPIGIGVQGLADTFNILRFQFDSPQAKLLNMNIFETIYYAALSESCEVAKNDGAYDSYDGSPMSEGKFQFDLWEADNDYSFLWDWEQLRKDIKKYGIRNSLVTALMPTASTSQIMGFNECFEPRTSNLYKRRTMAGEFVCINKYLVSDLIEMNLWDRNIRESIIHGEGSIQNIQEIPVTLKDLYKTAWEIKQKVLVDLSVDRGRFIDQSQSLNLFFESPTFEKLSRANYHGWKNGLKTGSYYIRSKSSLVPQKVIQKEEDCEACGS